MFTQLLDPLDNLTLTCLVALVPVVSLLILLAVFRWPAWLATLVGSIITFGLASWVWKMPSGDGWHAYLYGAATGVWNVDWITFWGMVLFNTLTVSGVFDKFRRWLIAHGTMDVRVQTSDGQDARSAGRRGLPSHVAPDVGSVPRRRVHLQTASVGVSTSKFVRKEGDVIRHNMGWTFILLAYLILIAIACYFLHPGPMMLAAAPSPS